MNGMLELLKCVDAPDANLMTSIQNGSVKLIPLTQGKVAIVDAEDYEWLNQWKWYAYKSGYTSYARRNIRVGKKKQTSISMHRFILHLSKGDAGIGDHKDRNGLHNWKDNLRIVTPNLNVVNGRRLSNNTSGFRGVVWSKKKRKWEAGIRSDYKLKFLGYFSDKTQAARAYDREAVRIWGNHAVLNFPEGVETDESSFCS
jgi:hypothetical protein